KATPDLLEDDRLLLLEEGHCMRDQALAFCNLRRIENINTFGASSLSTLVQMVAHGLGMTLLPELAVPLESRRGDIHL
ncbi:LysR substrate-binding domain-containing protein, partial [Klebsiella pneumoniae]|uniref:LysR substrate-binding domain-containing protein n=2 Tax=Pseudomonadota TaxID=1224 RepID=UPI0027311FF0